MTEHNQQDHLLALVTSAQAGDEAAFESLYEDFDEPILRYISFRVPTRDDAEDLAQQVFIRFYKNLANWTDQGYSPLAYIFTIARSVIADYWRSNKNRPIEASEAILPFLVDTSPRPEEQAYSKQKIQEILSAISRLPANYQEVVSLRLVSGLSNTEISKIISKSNPATRKLYSRGIQKLQLEINKDRE